jgi:uncharacterized protein DUF5076
MKELTAPPAAQRDANSVEMIRVWIAERELQCSIFVGMYKDSKFPEERAWGILLADVARHVSDALLKSGQTNRTTVSDIRDSFLRELDIPTSDTKGSFVIE